MTTTPPGFEEMKARAKATRQETGMSYGRALDAVAKTFGFRDWNAVSALLPRPKAPAPVTKIKNRTLFQIVLDYRMHDCLMVQFEVMQKLSRDHRDATFDQAYLDELMKLDVVEMMERSGIPNTDRIRKRMVDEFRSEAFNPMFKRDIWLQDEIRKRFRELTNPGAIGDQKPEPPSTAQDP